MLPAPSSQGERHVRHGEEVKGRRFVQRKNAAGKHQLVETFCHLPFHRESREVWWFWKGLLQSKMWDVQHPRLQVIWSIMSIRSNPFQILQCIRNFKGLDIKVFRNFQHEVWADKWWFSTSPLNFYCTSIPATSWLWLVMVPSPKVPTPGPSPSPTAAFLQRGINTNELETAAISERSGGGAGGAGALVRNNPCVCVESILVPIKIYCMNIWDLCTYFTFIWWYLTCLFLFFHVDHEKYPNITENMQRWKWPNRMSIYLVPSLHPCIPKQPAGTDVWAQHGWKSQLLKGSFLQPLKQHRTVSVIQKGGRNWDKIYARQNQRLELIEDPLQKEIPFRILEALDFSSAPLRLAAVHTPSAPRWHLQGFMASLAYVPCNFWWKKSCLIW